MITKKYLKRIIKIFNKSRGPLSKTTSNSERVNAIITFDKFLSNFNLVQDFYNDILIGNKYFTKNILDKAEEFLYRELDII